MRITLTIPSLGCGGAERVMCWLAGSLARRGHEVTLLAVRSVPVFYKIDPAVKVSRGRIDTPEEAGGAARALNFARRVLWLRREISAAKPDVIVGFEDVANVLMLCATTGSRTPVVLNEQVNPMQHFVPSVYVKLRKLLYPRAAALVMLTSDQVDWAASIVGKDKVRIIPSPASVPEGGGPEPDFFEPGRKHIIAVGRLNPQKGFDMLLEAFSKVSGGRPDWRLVILGEGSLRGEIENGVKRLGLAGRVVLPGVVGNVAAAHRRSEFFVLSSRYEGFPNALAEAMACGLPAVSFDCPSGPADIVRDGVDGVLVPPGDTAALAAAMARLMDSPRERERMSRNAAGITERFGGERVFAMWEAVINEAAGGK